MALSVCRISTAAMALPSTNAGMIVVASGLLLGFSLYRNQSQDPVLIPLFKHKFFIDELYDRCVKIVVSAAAPPTQLYHGERLQFEFERAASRLVEMQTQHYLAGSHRA